MERNKEMKHTRTPDAIVVFSGGLVSYTDKEGKIKYRSTTYANRDTFGTLGGYERVRATAELANRFPVACIVTTSRHTKGEPPTLAGVMAQELVNLGISRERIILEEISTNTASALRSSLQLAAQKGWKEIILVSNEYHMPRIKAFYEQEKSPVKAEFVSAEAVLITADSNFKEVFGRVKKTSAYAERLAAEQRGIEALHRGEYRPASPEDKMER